MKNTVKALASALVVTILTLTASTAVMANDTQYVRVVTEAQAKEVAESQGKVKAISAWCEDVMVNEYNLLGAPRGAGRLFPFRACYNSPLNENEFNAAVVSNGEVVILLEGINSKRYFNGAINQMGAVNKEQNAVIKEWVEQQELLDVVIFKGGKPIDKRPSVSRY